ncbi:unnamed protein product, partial [Trichobilharzia regenti]
MQPCNEVFAQHLLATCKQESGENLDQFVRRLKSLTTDCSFRAVTAEENRNESLRDSFISGIQSSMILQRLLEKRTLTFQAAYDQARALEMAHQQSQSYNNLVTPCASISLHDVPHSSDFTPFVNETTIAAVESKCFFCGNRRHPRSKCPARDAICKACGKQEHFQKVCRSAPSTEKGLSSFNSIISSLVVASAPQSLTDAVTQLTVNGKSLQTLVDTGSSESYISSSVV